MNQAQIIKLSITNILKEHGKQQINLSSKAARDKITNDILQEIDRNIQLYA